MADTIRSRTELLALLADNTTGDISPQDLRDMLVSLMGVYGGIEAIDESTPQTGIGTSPVKVTGWTENETSVGVTPDFSAGSLTILYDGVYIVSCQVSFSGTLNTTFSFHLAVDAVEQDEGFHRKLGTGGDVGSSSVTAIIPMVAGNVITLQVEADGAGKQITPVDMQLITFRIG